MKTKMTHADLMHGVDYSGQNVDGWLVQEKFDGLRALWTGKELVSRNGQKFNAPDWFTAKLPECPLDGELYAGRGMLSRISTRLARWKSGDDEDWADVRFKVFDAPSVPGGYLARWQSCFTWLPHTSFHIQLCTIRTLEAKGIESLRKDLKELQADGGEGFILRHPDAPYVAGRTDKMLKFKDANR